MFNNGKKKVILTGYELKILVVALNDFRNELINEGRYTDTIDELFIKLKNKIKIDKYESGAIIRSLLKKRESMITEQEDTTDIDKFLLKVDEVDKQLHK